MLGKIYIITNTVNDKVYIGQTIQPLKDRWSAHCRKGNSPSERNMHIKRAILKYGKDKFQMNELETCDANDLNEREIYYIKLYDSFNNGYNSTAGGAGKYKDLKLNKQEQKECIRLYKLGFSLRNIGQEYNVDKKTVKHVLEINNVELRKVRTYKLSSEDRQSILEDSKTLSRKEIMIKWNISKSYLSQLINGKRRI